MLYLEFVGDLEPGVAERRELPCPPPPHQAS
jgi:hypothetical protein